jgi:hypothetical protein
VQIREVLENYLDDDQDMRDMNLTAKEQHALQVAEAQVRGPFWEASVDYDGRIFVNFSLVNFSLWKGERARSMDCVSQSCSKHFVCWLVHRFGVFGSLCCQV